MVDADSPDNPWTQQDECAHPESAMEWWAIEAFFHDKQKEKQWSLKAALNNWQTKAGKIGTNYVFTLFDQITKKIYSFDFRDDTTRITAEIDCFDIRFQKNWMHGRFPVYTMQFTNPRDDITIKLSLKATVYPRWVAQDATQGWLPIGLGFYRYGFIPLCELSGTISIKGETIEIQGTGYFEHIWGDFTYHRTGAEFGKLKKTIHTYSTLAFTWFKQHTPQIPTCVGLATENNPLGYDWAWAVFDNGWTLFYGNILFWVMQGPAAGSLIISKDGTHYDELFDVQFQYIQTKKADRFSFHYPTCFDLHARYGDEQWKLRFTMDKSIHEYTVSFYEQRYWKGLVICEAPGQVEGTYSKEGNTTQLKGLCKIEPQRQVSASGHNTLFFKCVKPPKGVGAELSLESEVLKKKGYVKLHLIPPHFQADLKRFEE